MYSVYSKSSRAGASEVWSGEYTTASAAITVARHLHNNGYTVRVEELDDSDNNSV